MYSSSMSYTRRIVDQELDELFPEVAALALDGGPKEGGRKNERERGG